MSGNTLILGMGNTLLGDEGIGVHTVNALQNEHPALRNVDLMDGGTLSFVLAGPIEQADRLIVIDAAQLGASPGTVRLYEGREMDRFVMSSRHKSVHEVSLADLLVIAHLSGLLPQRRALIGIQPKSIDWSDTLSPIVVPTVATACGLVHKLLLQWERDSTPA